MEEIKQVMRENDEKKSLRTDEHKEREVWKCSSCPLEEKYDYKGKNPPFAKHLIFSEECYIMKDPFSPPNRGEVLVLGGDCKICNNPVCIECSIYLNNRFCNKCAMKNIKSFPLETHKRIKKLNSNTAEN